MTLAAGSYDCPVSFGRKRFLTISHARPFMLGGRKFSSSEGLSCNGSVNVGVIYHAMWPYVWVLLQMWLIVNCRTDVLLFDTHVLAREIVPDEKMPRSIIIYSTWMTFDTSDMKANLCVRVHRVSQYSHAEDGSAFQHIEPLLPGENNWGLVMDTNLYQCYMWGVIIHTCPNTLVV